jgi:hypothetical protein
MILNGVQIKNYKKDEFPKDPTKYANPELIIRLDKLRDFLGKPVYPSPVKNALARFSGSKTSRHYAVGRLSDACDVFIEGDKFEVYSKVLKSNLFTGIGLYFDTKYKNKPWMMMHLDLRENPLMWFRDITYYYPHQKDFYKKLHGYLNG